MRALTAILDFGITSILWTYFTAGYILFFSPFYIVYSFFPARREERFQRLNSRHFRVFFALVRALVPRVGWRIPEDVSSIRSSVIVANHVSYLDPILLMSLYDRQKTIVRPDYFRMPIFGTVLKASGFMASKGGSLYDEDMAGQMKNMKEFLAGGGNLYVFPEGTRSRSGALGPFDKGAFRIAKLCGAPIKAVAIRNTNRLYPPGRFRFNTQQEFDIELALAGSFEPDYENEEFSLSGLMADVRSAIERKAGR
jgi:1-acyl-sn-glycerol-3-phosphate acyltransferase